MGNIYWRITYNETGIYEALKMQIWNDENAFTKVDWENFKKSNAVNWLKIPDKYGSNHYSYFTKLGFDLFMKNTYPMIIKWLDEEKINIKKFSFDVSKMNLIYVDEHQIVIERK